MEPEGSVPSSHNSQLVKESTASTPILMTHLQSGIRPLGLATKML